MSDGSRIPTGFALFNAYINATKNHLLAGSGGVTNWERLGLTGAEINMWIAFCNTWNGYYAIYIDKDLRTRSVKDNMRKTISDFKLFAQPILEGIGGKSTATVGDFETFRIKRGILQDKSPTAVPVPTTHPVVVSININEPAEHIIRYKDELAGGRAKPFGVKFCELAYIVRDSENPPDSVDDCTKRVIAGRSPVTIHHANTDVGKRGFYFLRWINNRGEVGPWSPMYSALIA